MATEANTEGNLVVLGNTILVVGSSVFSVSTH